MLRNSDCLYIHTLSRCFRCALALTLVFAFCPYSESYADDLLNDSEYVPLDESEAIPGGSSELFSDVVSGNAFNYAGVVLDEDTDVFDWEQAKNDGASFVFVGAGKIDSDGSFAQDNALYSNLESCENYDVPFSLFVSGVKSPSDIALALNTLSAQLAGINPITIYFVLDNPGDSQSLLSAIAALKSDYPSFRFGVGANAHYLRENASFMDRVSIQRWAIDGYSDDANYADFYQLSRSTFLPGCSGSFTVAVGDCLPNEAPKVDISEVAEEGETEDSMADNLPSGNAEVIDLSVSSPRVLPDGVYEVSSAVDGSKALDIAGGSDEDCARLQLWPANSTPAQRFRLSYDEASGFYTVANVGSGKVLDAAAGRWEDGTAVQQYSANGTAAQLWSVEPDGDGYRICSALNPSQVLDVPGADASDGAGVQLYGANGTAAQRWTFKLVSCPVDLRIDYSGNEILPIDKYDGQLVVALPSSADPGSVTLRVGEGQDASVRLGSSRLLMSGD